MARALLEGKGAPAAHSGAAGAASSAILWPAASSRADDVRQRGGEGEGQPSGASLAAGPQPREGPAEGGRSKRRRGTRASAAALWEEGQPQGQIGAGRELTSLVRWYQVAKRAATAGELRPERAEQLAQRGLGLQAPDWSGP
jgi:hypothetical protein